MLGRLNKVPLAASMQVLIQKIEQFPWIAALLIAGAVLRISGFMAGGIWYDELFSLQMTHQALWEMIQSLKLNINPPGFEVLLWFLTRLFGWNSFSLRVLSVLASILSMWMIIKLAGLLKLGRAQQIASLTLVALLPFQLIIGQQGRVYALLGLLYLLGLYCIASQKWVGLGLVMGAMLWCQTISLLLVPGLVLIALVFQTRTWKKVVITAACALVSFLPWLGITLVQVDKPMPWFVPLTPEFFIYQSYISLFGWYQLHEMSFNLLELLWVGLLILGSVILCMVPPVKRLLRVVKKPGGVQNPNRDLALTADPSAVPADPPNAIRANRLLFMAFFLPLVFMLTASLLVKNIILSRTLFLLVAPFILWLVNIFVGATPKPFHILVWTISLVFLFAGLLTWTPNQLGGNISQFSTIVKASFRPGDVFYHDTGLSAMVFMYYFPEEPNYLVNGDSVLGLTDLRVAKIHVPQLPPDQLPAHRAWVVWTHSPDLAVINKRADEETRWMVAKCPLIMNLPYPQSWNVEVYLCDLQK